MSANESADILDNLANDDSDLKIVDSQGIYYTSYMFLNAIVF